MERRGLNLQEHRAQPVTEALVSKACLIVCMSKAHADALRVRFPLYADRVHTFSAPIPDPFGSDDAVYEQTAQTLEAEVAVVYHLLSAEKK